MSQWGMIPSSWGSFDEAWPQPFENFQRIWSFDRTVTIAKPLVTFPWRSLGFYALTGQSVITFKKELVKETIVEALEEIRKQNPPDRILLVADNYGSHHAKLTQQRADELGIEFVFIPPYSPTLNAIEPLWKDVKREISPIKPSAELRQRLDRNVSPRCSKVTLTTLVSGHPADTLQ